MDHFKFTQPNAQNEAAGGESIRYLSVVSGLSKNKGQYAHKVPILDGELSVNGDPTLRGVGVFVFPIALPHNGREYRDAGDFSILYCRSNDGIVPVFDMHEIPEPRLGVTVRIDKQALRPNQYAVEANGTRVVGGCGACPLSKWAKQLKLETNTPGSPCEPISFLYLYALSSLVPLAGQFEDSHVTYFRQHGFDQEKFFEYSWDEPVVMILRSYARQSLVTGVYTTPDKVKHEVVSIEKAVAPYTISLTAKPSAQAFLKEYVGMPAAMLAFGTEAGDVYTVKEVEQMDGDLSELSLIGFFPLLLTTEQFMNRLNNYNQVPVVILPDNTFPVLTFGSSEFEKYAELRQRASHMSVPEMLGFNSNVISIEQVKLPPTNQHLFLPPSSENTSDEYGYESVLDNL